MRSKAIVLMPNMALNTTGTAENLHQPCIDIVMKNWRFSKLFSRVLRKIKNLEDFSSANQLCNIQEKMFKQSNIIKWIVAIGVCLIANVSMSAEIDAIGHPDKNYTGLAEIQYPSVTTLSLAAAPGLKIVVNNYKGRWKEGLAEGYGELSGLYVIPQTENPLSQQLQSTDPGIRGQAIAAIERVRVDAVFVKQDPDEAVRRVLGEKVIRVTYSGEFKNGVAMGYGELASESRELKGTFYKWLPEGLVTHYMGDFPIITETYSNGVPSDGPVLINQYPPGVPEASRRFVGAKFNGKLSGDWYEMQWRIENQDYSTVGMGDTTQTIFKDKSRSKCKYDASLVEAGTTSELDRLRGDAEMHLLQKSDPMYIRTPKSCSLVNPTGWVFNFSLVGAGPLDTKPAPPYSCSDPEGREGVFSISEKGEAICKVTSTVTVTTYDWRSKIWREVERVGRGVKKIILWPIEKVGKATTDTLCDVAQKEPGKDCNVSITTGKTFEIPDNKEAQQQRAQADLGRFLAAREKLFAANSPDSVKGQWEPAAKALDKCAVGCVGPARAFSMLTIQEIQSLMATGFEDDIKRYRLASFTGKNGSIFDIFKPYYPFEPPKMDAAAVLNAMSDVLDNSLTKIEVDTPLQKYVGGIGAAMDAVNMAIDYNTLLKIQNKIAWITSTLKGGEVAYISISVTPGGDVSLVPLLSKDADVFEDPGSKTVRTTIVGVMTTSELMHKLDKQAREKANAELQIKIDEDLRQAIQNSWKK
jgi:hypothetical protein